MSQVTNPSFKELAKEASLLPQEKMLALKKKKHALSVGIPKESTFQEHRVPLSPMAVQMLVQNGHHIRMESGCGEKANFSDYEYSKGGAEIVNSPKEIFECDIVLKVAPPTVEEINLMKPKQVLISAIQLVKTKDDLVKRMINRGVTAIGYEFLRNDEDVLPIIRSMSEIAGRASIMIASEYLSHYNSGKGELFGGIPGIQPTQVVVIGAGAVGEYAIRAAIGLGASVKVFDDSIHHLRRLEQSIGTRIHSSTIIPSILAKALEGCDVAVGALRSKIGLSPCVVSESMVQNMRPKSIIIDISIDQGGCFETSETTNHKMPVFEKYEVLHYCVPNIPSRYARTASYALSNIFTPLLQEIADEGGIDACLSRHSGLRQGTYIYKGSLTNSILGQRYNMPVKQIEFLLAGY